MIYPSPSKWICTLAFCLFCVSPGLLAQDADGDGISDAEECSGTSSPLSMSGVFAGQTTDNTSGLLSLSRAVNEGPQVNGTLNQSVSTTIAVGVANGEVITTPCAFTITTNGRFDDGIHVEVGGQIVLQFNSTHWASDSDFANRGKFNTNSNSGIWTPWINEGSPSLIINSAGLIELLVNTRGGGRENALDDMNPAPGTGANAFILNSAPLLAADCAAGVPVTVRQSNRDGPGRRPAITIAASVGVCTDGDGNGTPDSEDPCTPGPSLSLASITPESGCDARDGATTIRIDDAVPGINYTLLLNNTTTNEEFTVTGSGNPTLFNATGLAAGGYTADVVDPTGRCGINQVQFTIGGTSVAPGGISTQPILWLRADAGVTTNAARTQVQRWVDQSPAMNDAVGDGSAVSYVTTGEGMNYNPSVTFDPTLDPNGRLGGTNPLGLVAGGQMQDFTFFVVPRITDPDGGNCGDDVFNFFDDENLFEVENFVPKDGCEQFVNNFSYGIFNGGETSLQNTENRDDNIIGIDYASPGGVANFQSYGNGSDDLIRQINNYRDPLVNASRTYSIGQALSNRAAGNRVAPVEIGEVIIFPGVLSDDDREIVNSYLAIKFGVNLVHAFRGGDGAVIYDVNGNRSMFSSNVFGIGRNDCARFEQRQSRSALPNQPLTIGVGTIAENNADNPNPIPLDNSYLLTGNNGERPAFTGSGGTAAYGSVNARVYKVSEFLNGAPGDAFQDLDVRFDRLAGGIPNAPASTFGLLVDRDGDGNFSNAEEYTDVSFDADGSLVFSGVDLDHGDCFTIARLSCEIDIMSIIADCNADQFDITVNVDYDYAYNTPATPGRIVATVNNQRYLSDPLTTAAGTTAIRFTLSGNFPQTGIIVNFEQDQLCSDAEFLNLVSCTLACVAQPDAISGVAYPDYNLNGVRDVGEGALPGAIIRVYDCDGNLVGSGVTGNDGAYSIGGLPQGQDYRVEFIAPPTSLTVSTYADRDNPLTNTDIQFAPAGTCNLNIGAINPDFCDAENTQYVTACFTRLNPAQNPNADVVISFKGTGGSNSENPLDYVQPPEHPINIGVGQVGPINGLAYDRQRQRLYMSTTVKAETEFPAGGGIADIYVADNSPNDGTDGTVTTATRLVNFETDCGFSVGTYGTDFGTPAINDGVDDQVFETVGKIGIGEIDLSATGDVLYATNLFSRSLIVLPLDDGGAAQCAEALQVPIPVPASCVGKGIVRPWAIGRRSGFPEMYVGAVCDASISDDRADLRAFVFRFDPATNTFDETPVLDFALDYPRQTNFARRLRAEWLPWIEDRNDAAADVQSTYCCGNTYFVVYPQPILSDIAFDRGDMVLGFMDRFANQVSQIPETSPKNYSSGLDFILPNGDLLRAGLNANNTWSIEDGGFTNGVITGQLPEQAINKGFSGRDATAGPGGDEFYWQDDYRRTADHYETSLGAVALVPGQFVAVNTWDPVRGASREYGTGGVNFYNNNNGNWVKSYKLYGGVGAMDEGTFGKGAGFGDIEPVCERVRVEIGNYVFSDEDMDGVQDACDPPIADVPVALFAPDGTLRATTTTSELGQYYFSSANYPGEDWVDPLDSLDVGDEFVLVFGYDATAPANSPFNTTTNILSIGDQDYTITLSNQEAANGSDDRSDSDATLSTDAGRPWAGYPTIRSTLGQTQTNFTFDAGFIRQTVDVALQKQVAGTPPFRQGDNVAFDIRVVNQGTKPLRTVRIADAAGSGLQYNAAANQSLPVSRITAAGATTAIGSTSWALNGSLAETELTIPGTFGLDSGDTLLLQITYTLTQPDFTDPGRFINVAEVSRILDLQGMDVSDQDEDSTIDSDLTNDGGGRAGTPSDDALDGNGTGAPGSLAAATDEDDADPALVPITDVALTKNVDITSFPAGRMPVFGDQVEFFITVVNQGNTPVSGVSIFDDVPCGYTAANSQGTLLPGNAQAGWSGSDATGLRNNITSRLLPGQSVRVSLFAILRNPTNNRPGCGIGEDQMPYVNSAEVASIEDSAGNIVENDFDSNFDEDDGQEDGGGMVNDLTDNVVTGDGTGTFGSNDPATDDDDQDVANIDLIDVALRKIQDPSDPGAMPKYRFGQTVKFRIDLISQGNVPVTQFDVVDYLPEGLEYNAGLNAPLGWSYNAATRRATATVDVDPDLTPSTNMDGLQLGEFTSICLYANVVSVSLNAEDFVNRAEITQFFINPVPNPNLPGLPPLMAGTRDRDADSVQDNNPDNDPGGVAGSDDDDNVDGLGLSANEDEDDADPTQVEIVQPVTVGNYTFIDVDMDGTTTAGDFPAIGMTVTIRNADGSAVTEDILGNPYVATLRTGADGRYLFDSLPPGNYVVTFDRSTITNADPSYYEYTGANAGNNDDLDSDADVDGNTPPTGDLDDGDVDLSIDAGLVCVTDVDALGPMAAAPVICEDGSLTLASLAATVAPAGSGARWTTAGDGLFNSGGNYATATTYTPGAQDIANGQVTLTLTNDLPPALSGCSPDVDQVVLTINALPEVEAGADQTICADAAATVMATVTGSVTGGAWTTSGDGTITPGSNNVATYTPGTADQAAGTATLTFTSADPAGPCGTVSDDLTLRFNPVATIGVSEDQETCENDAVTVSATLGGSAAGGTWSTTGTGTFADATALSTRYTPGAVDGPNRRVVLTFTSNDPAGPCGASSDELVLIVSDQPTVDAGADQTICKDGIATLSATVGGGATSGAWSSSEGAAGSFADPQSRNTTYTPGPVTGNVSTVILTFTSNDPDGPCGAESDLLVLSVNDVATVDAGENQTICEDGTAMLEAELSGSATSGVWSAPSGSFDDENSPTAIYTPAAVIGGPSAVMLTFTSNDPDGAGPCDVATDVVTITVNDLPEVTVSANQTICEDATAAVSATLGGSATGGTWTTSGAGTFASTTSPSTTYTPGPVAAGSNTVTLTFTTDDPDGAGPCGDVSAALTLTVNDLPEVAVGDDQTICEDAPATISATLSGSATGGSWASPGGGTFADANSATTTFTPPAVSGNQTFTLTFTTNDPAGPCGAASDALVITVNDLPTVEAGAARTICEGETVTLAGSFGGGATSVAWSGGAGTYAPNEQSPTATYTPTVTEVAAGTVTLTLTTDDPAGPCGTVSDDIVITIINIPMVDAGEDRTICSDADADLAAGISFTNGTTATDGAWSIITAVTSGTLTDNDDGTASYTPGTNETGAITFRFTADDVDGVAGSCPVVFDEVTVTFTNSVVSIAGTAPDDVCSDAAATLVGTVNLKDGTSGSGVWSLTNPTTAAGTLGTTTNNEAVYTPGDGETGDVEFTFTATDPDGDGPCVGGQTTSVTLTISDVIASIVVGGPTDICSDNTATLTANINLASGAMNTNGTWSAPAGLSAGSFADQGGGTAIFDPADAELGTYTFTFTATDPDGDGPCVGGQTETVTVDVSNAIASVEAGEAQTICSDATASVSGTVTFLNGDTNQDGTWSTTAPAASGTLTNGSGGTATFEPADDFFGDVTLTFTANDPDGDEPCAGGQTDAVVVTINDDIVSVEAGDPVTICSDETTTLSGVVNLASGGTTVAGSWSSNPTLPAGVFSDNDDGTANFDPADATIGDYVFTFTADDPDGPCAGGQTDQVTVTVDDVIDAVEAGEAVTICSDGGTTLSGVITLASGATTTAGTWSSNDGLTAPEFVAGNDGTATFDPAAATIGDYTFTFTASDPDGPCGGGQTDQVTVTVNDDIVGVEAGAPQNICSDAMATLTGVVNLASGATTAAGSWSSNTPLPNTIFTDNDDGTATFNPGDATIGDYVFTFTADEPAGPCAGGQADTVTVTVNDDIVSVGAGVDRVICSDASVALSGVVNLASGATTVAGSWTSDDGLPAAEFTDDGGG